MVGKGYKIHVRGVREETPAMTEAEFIKKIRSIDLPPKQLAELGLRSNWQARVEPAFMTRVFKTAVKYKNVLKELSKR